MCILTHICVVYCPLPGISALGLTRLAWWGSWPVVGEVNHLGLIQCPQLNVSRCWGPISISRTEANSWFPVHWKTSSFKRICFITVFEITVVLDNCGFKDGCFNMKLLSCQYRKSHCGNKMVLCLMTILSSHWDFSTLVRQHFCVETGRAGKMTNGLMKDSIFFIHKSWHINKNIADGWFAMCWFSLIRMVLDTHHCMFTHTSGIRSLMIFQHNSNSMKILFCSLKF